LKAFPVAMASELARASKKIRNPGANANALLRAKDDDILAKAPSELDTGSVK